MAAQSEKVWPDAGASRLRPIELVTENGFSIVRLWELNDEPAPTHGPFTLIVRACDGPQETVAVEIARAAIVEIEIHTLGRILGSNSFWICCAENHLAAHLSKYDECPGNRRLRVETLTPADLNLSIRWERS